MASNIYFDYSIPAGYAGVLYSGDVFYYYDDDYIDIASGTSLCEFDDSIWYEDLDMCVAELKNIDRICYFNYPHGNYRFARIVVDGIELDGTETPGETGWNYNRLAYPAYLGEIIENPDYEE